VVGAAAPGASAAQPFWSRSYYERNYLPRASALTADFTRHLAWLETRARPGRCLDIGCGAGHFAAAAAQRGWQVTGLDPSPEALTLAAKVAPGARLFRGSVSALPAGERFDLISFWDSLAYVPDLAGTLTAVRRRLAPGGLLLIKTPHLPPRFFYVLQALLWWRPGLRDEYARSQSRWYFTPGSLRRVLDRFGFEPLAAAWAAEVPGPDEEAASWRGRARAGLQALLDLAAGPHRSCIVLARPRGPAKADAANEGASAASQPLLAGL
jgi:SAM-dependent methyltransferase